MLPDHHIARRIASDLVDLGIGVDPFAPDLIQPASLDVRLGYGLRRMLPGATLDPGGGYVGEFQAIDLYDDAVHELSPGDFVLAHTLEELRIPDDVVARLEGKSTLGRCGLRVHSTAGFIDAGFHGQITLELSVDGPRRVLLRPGMRIGQLSFHRLDAPCAYPYGHDRHGSHYQGQRGATVPAPLAEPTS